MQSRACVGHEIGVLDDEKVSAGVGWDDFERQRAETEGVKMAGAVLAGGNGMEGRSSGVSGELCARTLWRAMAGRKDAEDLRKVRRWMDMDR